MVKTVAHLVTVEEIELNMADTTKAAKAAEGCRCR